MSNGNLSTSLSSIFNSLSLTGNPYLDGLILSSLIPMIIGYVSTLTSFVKSFIAQIAVLLWKYIRMVIKTKTVGNLLCKVELDKDNELFPIIKNTIFCKTVESDLVNQSMLGFISTYDDVSDGGKSLDGDTKYLDYWYKQRYEMDRTFDIQKDYTGDSFITSSYMFGYNDIERKFFKYKDFLLKFTMKTIKKQHGDDDRKIVIEILSFKSVSTDKEDTKKYIGILELFLKDRFKINEAIYYVYKMRIAHTSMSNCITTLLSNGFSNSSSGLLSYGDETGANGTIIVDNQNKFALNNVIVDSKIENISDASKSLVSDINLYDNTKNHSDGMMGFDFLYKKYIAQVTPYTGTYGYFIKGGDIYFIYTFNKSWIIEIVSFGKRLTDADLKDRIDMLIKLSLKRNMMTTNLKQQKGQVSVYKRIDKKWAGYKLDPRNFSTIYLPDKMMDDIKSEIQKFMAYEKLYSEFQIPYKKGLLFYGPPGTGKTSLVKALAYEYQMNIYMVNVNDDEINDDTITNILNSLGGGNKILLFEDIDTAFADKEKMKVEIKTDVQEKDDDIFIQRKGVSADKSGEKPSSEEAPDASKKAKEETVKNINMFANMNSQPVQMNKKFLTYSGLLNAMDGVLSNQHGLITIMTTNNIHKLGDAFIRPGRIDRMFELKECDREQITKMTWSLLTKKMKIIKQQVNDGKMEVGATVPTYDREYIKSKIEEFAGRLTDDKGMSKIKPCELQFYLLAHIDNIEMIFDNYKQLIR